MEYDRARKEEAGRLGIQLSTLDDLVRKERGDADEPTHGRRLSFHTPDPWDHPVNPADLLSEIAAAIESHVILSSAARDAIALWIAHTWVYQRFQHTPRLGITSPEKRCGKSTLLDLLRATCLQSVKADNISASSVFRTVEALAPLTLLIDEADSFLRDNEELRGTLNSGFEQSGMVIRTVEIQGEHQPVQFGTFAPVALAAIGKLPGTLEDRAIPIRLERKQAGQAVAKMRDPGARGRLQNLARKLVRWAKDDAARLGQNPAIPAALNDREGDISVPLLSIADAAGPAWAQRGRAALLTMFGQRANDDESSGNGAMLLADIRSIFRETGGERITSADLATRLGEMEDRPWAEWRQGKPMTAPQLSRALSPFRVRPRNMKVAGTDKVLKAYQADHFEDVWNRYLSPPAPIEGDQTATRYSIEKHSKISNLGTATEKSGSGCVFEKDDANCSGVAGSGFTGGYDPEKDELGL